MAKKKGTKKGKRRTFVRPLGKEEVHWADMARVRFAEEKFLVTFAQAHPDKNEYIVISEIILPPKVAAGLSTILSSSVADHEKNYCRTPKPRRKKEK